MWEEQETGCAEGRANLRMVLIGGRNSGKSSAGNTILRRRVFQIDKLNCKCVRGLGSVAGRNVAVVDTPGWDYFSDAIPQEIQRETERSVSLSSPGPHAFLLTIPVGTAIIQPRLEQHMHLLGAEVWRYTLVLFTCGDRLADSTIEQYIASQGEALQQLLGKCRNRYHVLNNSDVTDETQVTELLNKVEHMRSSNLGCYTSEILQPTYPDAQRPRQPGADGDEREEHQSCRSPELEELRVVCKVKQVGRWKEVDGEGRGAQAERKEQRGRTERAKGGTGAKEACLRPSHTLNMCASSAPVKHTQALQQLGNMAAVLSEVTETLRETYEEQAREAREEAERHRDTAFQLAALRARSKAASQEYAAALTQRDRERDELQAEVERLRESCEEKDKEIERLKEEVAKVKQQCEETSREMERNKQVLQQVQAVLTQVNSPAEGE